MQAQYRRTRKLIQAIRIVALGLFSIGFWVAVILASAGRACAPKHRSAYNSGLATTWLGINGFMLLYWIIPLIVTATLAHFAVAKTRLATRPITAGIAGLALIVLAFAITFIFTPTGQRCELPDF